MLVRIPSAVHKVGISFTTLDIEVPPPETFSALTQSEVFYDLSVAVQKLRSFIFHILS